MNLKEVISNYKPVNEQETCDKELMLEYLNTFDDCLTRDNKMCHFTASCWIVNKNKTKVLMIYHNIYKSWSWVGGHADGDSDLLHVALKEANEETGLTDIKTINNLPIAIEILTVDPHIKRGKYVSSHVHLDCCFLFEASEDDEIRIKEDENSNIAWIPIEEVNSYTSEEKMKPIYTKIINKIKNN